MKSFLNYTKFIITSRYHSAIYLINTESFSYFLFKLYMRFRTTILMIMAIFIILKKGKLRKHGDTFQT
jgi:hypothetical protein